MKPKLRMKSLLAVVALACLAALGTMIPAQAAAPGGSYQLVGLGPAGMDLMTPRQLKAIEEADIVFCRPNVQKMLSAAMDFEKKQVIDGYNHIFAFYGKACPKGEEKKQLRRGKTCEEYHQKQAEFVSMVKKAVADGKKVVMTTSGDPTIYSPGIWTVLALKELKPKVVPGLSAFNAANAALQARLGEVIITAPFDKKGAVDSLESLAQHKEATLVIFMPRDTDKVFDRLAKVYPADTPVGAVIEAGFPEKQKVVLGTMGDIKQKLTGNKSFNTIVYVGKALATSQYRAEKKSQAKGKYYLVGVGPGDPDLATLRAREVIKKADIIFVHQRLKNLFGKELEGKEVIEGYHRLFPFYGSECPKKTEQNNQRPGRRERMSCEQYHQKQAEFAAMVRKAVAQGKIVAQLDSGDPMVFGPCNWSLTELKDIDTEVVPGMSCFNAANAALGVGVTGGKTSHSVLLASGWSVEKMARQKATMVLFTMRTDFKKFIDALRKHYPPDTPVGMVIKAGYADQERVVRSTLGQVLEQQGEGRLPFEYLLYVGDALINDKPY
ncbi:tetrapyrrole methylase [Desulfocarbo indianensis]|nr:tetrapyrrole methylase [Desulfocarbo indianensis]